MYTLRFGQIIDANLQVVWEFLCNPHNLNAITPHDLEFEIVSDVPSVIVNGLLIQYRVKIPYIGRRVWVSEIKHIRQNFSFVDEQRIGPYAFWYHCHEIEKTSSGVRMIDTVSFVMPYGVFGKLLYSLFIRKTLLRIFAFRQARFREILEKRQDDG